MMFHRSIGWHKPSRSAVLPIAAAFLLVLGGCVVVVEESLTLSGSPGIDDRLVGTWSMEKAGESGSPPDQVFVDAIDQDGMAAVVVDRGTLNVAYYRFWTTTIDAQGWMSIEAIAAIEDGKTEQAPGAMKGRYLPGRYDVAGDGRSFTLRMVRQEHVKDVAKSGRLQVRREDDDTVVVSSRDDLRRVFAGFPAAAFGKPIIFRRNGN